MADDFCTQEIGQLHRLLAHIRAELEAADADESCEVDLHEADFEAYTQLDVHPLDFGVGSSKPEMESAVLELGAALGDAVTDFTIPTFDEREDADTTESGEEAPTTVSEETTPDRTQSTFDQWQTGSEPVAAD